MSSQKRFQRLSQVLVGACAALLLSACSYTFMRAPIASMTQTKPPSGEGKPLKKVSATYCAGDEAKYQEGNLVGMMDEAIGMAQTKAKADYIKDAVFTREFGFFKNCMKVSGMALKK